MSQSDSSAPPAVCFCSVAFFDRRFFGFPLVSFTDDVLNLCVVVAETRFRGFVALRPLFQAELWPVRSHRHAV